MLMEAEHQDRSRTSKNNGFDIHDYSEFNDPGVLVQLYYPPKKPANKTNVAELQDCSLRAIEQYNREHQTHYGNAHVVKANSEPLAPCRYYITFEATDEKNNNKQIFQERVNIFFPEWQKEVELVRRIKTPNQLFCCPQATQSVTHIKKNMKYRQRLCLTIGTSIHFQGKN
ncbi:uncharacterized protein LOC141659280 [Apium graveolens]|uniref:uncharacterized protein LOC141659280 n=1 Tax=Apium graveolens TaxID=4045 RepID=UPI003D7A1639